MSSLVETIKNLWTSLNRPCELADYEHYAFLPLHKPCGEDDEDAAASEASEECCIEGEGEEEDMGNGERKGPSDSLVAEKLDETFNALETASTETIINLSRSLGFAPSKADERMMREKWGATLDKSSAVEWINTLKHQEDSVKFLSKVFAHFDQQGLGTLPAERIKAILMTLGGENSLEEEEVNVLLNKCGGNLQAVDYSKLIDTILERP